MLSNLKSSIFNKYTYISLAIIGLLAVIVPFIMTQYNQRVLKVTVIGSYTHTENSMIEDVIEAYLPRGFYKLRLQQLSKSLKALPWVKDVRIWRKWPGTLVVSLEEKIGVAIWNGHWIFDVNGNIFYPEVIKLDSLPKIDGPVDSKQHAFTQFKTINEHLATLGLKIAHYTLDQRLSVTIFLDNDMQIILGKDEPVAKLERFVLLYNDMSTKKKRAAERVDLRYPKGIAIKWKK